MDWLTALLPLLLFSWFYYRWQAAALQILAIAGYLTAAQMLSYTKVIAPRILPATVTGLVVAFCMPATTPLWPAALAGVIAAAVAAVPGLLQKRWPNASMARPLVQPALVGFLFVRLLFPSAVTTFTMPVQWSGVDGLSAATPLATLWGEGSAVTRQHLLLGIHAGSIGEGSVIAMVLAILFLLTRQRLRPLAPLCMLVTVSLLSWMVWNSPLYALLAGGLALGALLLADNTYTTATPGGQVVMGVLAGVLVVLLRRHANMDGTAVAVVAVGMLQPVLPPFFALCRWIGRKLAPLWPLFLRFCRWSGAKLAPLFAKLWQLLRPLFHRCVALFNKIKEKFAKNKNNG